MCQAGGSESTEPYLFFRQQWRREGFGRPKQKKYRYNTRSAPPSLTLEANRMAEIQAVVLLPTQRRRILPPPPITSGKAGGKFRVNTRCPTSGRTLVQKQS